MKYSKLFEILLSFNQKELKQFIGFASKVSTIVQNDIVILKYIIKKINEVKTEVLTETIINHKIKATFFENTKTTKTPERQWILAKSRLLKAGESFIIHLKINQDIRQKNQFLLEYFQEKKLTNNFDSQLKINQKHLKKELNDLDSQYYNYKLLETILYHKFGQRKLMKELVFMDEVLDNFYVENKLRILAEQHNRSFIINSLQPNSYILSWIDEKKLNLNTITSKIYYHLYLMITTPLDTSHFQKLKVLIHNNTQAIRTNIFSLTISYLLNQCVLYCRQDKIEFAKEYTELVDFFLKNNLYSKEKGLSIGKYLNAVTMGILSNQLDWSEVFLEKHSDKIKHPEIDNLKKLNQANILFNREQFDEAWHELSQCHLSEMYFKIIEYKLYIKLFFEKKEFKALNSKILAFQKYIERQSELSKERKDKNINFSKRVKAITKKKELKQLEKKNYLFGDYLWLRKVEGSDITKCHSL